MISFPWSKVIDEKAFLETVGSDPSFLDTLIELLRQQSKENMHALSSAAERGDEKAVKQAAHDLKNIGRNIASPKLIKHSTHLETLAADKQLEAVRDSLDKTTKLLTKALEELQALQKALRR